MPLARSLLGLTLGLVPFAPALAGDLDLTIGPLKSDTGRVMVAVYDRAASFMKDDQQVVAVMLPARGGSARVVLGNLAPGRYAVSVFHDANGNGKLDKNLVGMPSEPYGFSRDARGNFGPPEFDAAAVELADQPVALTITLGN